MARAAKIHFTGEITRADINAEMKKLVGNGTGGLLHDVAVFTTDAMKKHVKGSSFNTGRLYDSISWKTADGGPSVQGEAKPEDEIDKPKEVDTVYMGTQNYYAAFRENGTPAHTTGKDADKYVEAMKLWCFQVLNIRWNGTPEERFHFWNVVKYISSHGTVKAPFAAPVLPLIAPYAVKTLKKGLRTFLKKANKK